MSDQSRLPQLCAACPLLPTGVRGELVSSETVTMAELRRYRFAVEQPELAEPFVGLTRICVRATASADPHVEVGDEASMLVQAGGKNDKQIAKALEECTGPARSKLQRLLGIRGICPHLSARRDYRDTQ